MIRVAGGGGILCRHAHSLLVMGEIYHRRCPSGLTVCSFTIVISIRLIMPPPLVGACIKRWCCLTSVWLTSVCLSRTSWPKSRTERPRKTKIGTEVPHVTRDSDTTFKVKRSKVKVTRPLYSPRRLRIRQLQRWPWERIHRGNLLLRCGHARSARRREALRRPQREKRGGDIWWRLPHSLFSTFIDWIKISLVSF